MRQKRRIHKWSNQADMRLSIRIKRLVKREFAHRKRNINVGAYWPTENEPNILSKLISENWKWYLPTIDTQNKVLEYHFWYQKKVNYPIKDHLSGTPMTFLTHSDIQHKPNHRPNPKANPKAKNTGNIHSLPKRKSAYGINSTVPMGNKRAVFPIRSLDVVLLPVVAFTSKGDRLGRGGGYYDRTFSTFAPSNCAKLTKNKIGTNKPVLVGVGWEFQSVPTIPTRHWDIPLDFVLTPNRTIATKVRH